MRKLSVLYSQGGNILVGSLVLAGIAAAGGLYLADLSNQNSRNNVTVLFSAAARNLGIHAETILSDAKACEDAFKGLAMPVAGTPVRSQLPNQQIRPRLAAGEIGSPPLMANADYQDGKIRMTDIRLVAGPVANTYFLEMEMSKRLNLLFSYGGEQNLVRRFAVDVVESTSAPGTIGTCSTMKVDVALMTALCTAMGSRYDPSTLNCVVCPTAGEYIVGWSGPTQPVCKSVDQVVCEVMGEKSTWISATKSCLTCGATQVMLNAGTPSAACADSVNIAALNATLVTACAGTKYAQFDGNQVLQSGCM